MWHASSVPQDPRYRECRGEKHFFNSLHLQKCKNSQKEEYYLEIFYTAQATEDE